jgi:uncharacterized protein YndB with AHSA1/START domain
MTTERTYDLTLNRTIAASPEEVYDAWLDPKVPCNPWHNAARLDWSPKSGELWYFLQILEGNDYRPHFGRFAILDRPNRIQLNWMSRNTRGLESTVTVTLHPKGNETLLTLNHANIPDDDMGRAHEMGWKHYSGLLEQRFATKQENT